VAQMTPTRTLGGLPIRQVTEATPHMNILIYGDPGVGKTVLAGSADNVPEMRDVILIDVEGGSESLKRTYPNVQQVRVTSWQELQNVYDHLHSGRHEFKTVILDSLSEAQKIGMYDVLARREERKPSDDPEVAGMREWGINLEQVRKMVRAYRDLPMNTIITALARVDKNTLTGRETTLPGLTGKGSSEVAGFMDIVGYYYVKEVDGEQLRCLLTQKTSTQIAKDRTGKLPVVVTNPTMKSLWNMIAETETQTKENSSVTQ
jgi:hypothetical protein